MNVWKAGNSFQTLPFLVSMLNFAGVAPEFAISAMMRKK